jgi:hypothetical protein
MRILAIAAVVALFAAPASGRAQTVESPVSFDSAHRVLAITPAMVQRLNLVSPTWPVAGEFKEAHLFSVSPGDAFTLVVQRPSGASERFTLSANERDALRAAIDAGMTASGRPSAEIGSDLVSEPAGNRFAVHLTTLAAIAYGPLAASLFENDGQAAGAAWLLTTGLTFFVSYSAAQSSGITRAQSDLAGDLGLVAGGSGLLLGYAATGDADQGVRGLALASAIIGTAVCAGAAVKMSDAEVHGAMMGVRMGSAFGVAASRLGGADGRSTAAVAVAGAMIGFPLGLAYPRHAGYLVTAGDAEAMGTSGLIGAAWAAATLGDNPSSKRVAGSLALGYFGGGLIGSQVFARQFNLTRTQATVIDAGALAGGLVGLAIPVLSSQNNEAAIWGAAAGGATLGVALLAGSFPLASKAGTPVAGRLRRLGAAQFSVSPLSALALAGRAAGQYSLVNVRF